MIIGGVIAGLLTLILAAIFLPGVVPSLINVALSVLVGYKLPGPTWLRVGIAIAFSALLSMGVRIPSLLAGDPNEVRSTIVAKTLVGPREKVRIEGPTEGLFYRTHSDPPSFGLDSNLKWGFRRLFTYGEYPEAILREAGIASTTSEQSRVVVRIGMAEQRGILEVKVVVLDGGTVVATYAQRVRRSYPFEEFDESGFFAPGDWRPIALYLTQDTFWARRHQFAVYDSHPLKDFLLAALAQGGIVNDRLVVPIPKTLENSVKVRTVEARFVLEPEAGSSVPLNAFVCKGRDAGHGFEANGPNRLIHWDVKDVPAMNLARAVTQGRYLVSWTAYCGEPENTFWFASYGKGLVDLWQYRVEFDGRNSYFENWLQAEVPATMRAVYDGMRYPRVQIVRVDDRSALLYISDNLRTGSTKAPDLVYRIDMPLR